MKKRPAAKSTKAFVAGTKATLPRRIEVQLATLAEKAPEGDQWLHEIKFDGYRMICRIDGKNVKFISRNHQDWTGKMNSLVEAVREIPVKQAVIDGEVVVMNSEGITDFQALQNAFRDHTESQLRYYAFDILYLNGRSLTTLPLEERKALLADLLATNKSDSPLHYSGHVCGSGEQFHDGACKLGLEGCISKLRNAPHRPGRGYNWLKVKCQLKEEFVIGGYTEPSGLRVGFGALLLGYYDADKHLRYAGKVGTGFDNEELSTLLTQFKVLEQSTSPFIDRVTKTGDIRTAHWLTPSLVAQITYGSRTREGILRHAVYSGLREDKAANEVTLDKAMPVKKAIQKAAVKSIPLKTPSDPAEKAAVSPHSTARSTNKGAVTTKGGSTYDVTSATFAGVRLTHPAKVLYPDTDVTKLEVAAYYEKISEWMLPHIAHRPLVLVRCPDGQAKECFYQKHPGIGTPGILRQIPIRESDKTENYVVVDNVEGLVALAQIGALEVHAWGSKEDKLDKPDRLVFDMDPSPEVTWERVVQGARHICQFLRDLGLQSFVKTTGGKGLHLVVPIERRHDWDEAKPFCKAVADAVVIASPNQYTANMSKAARKNKIFLDYLRNGRGATAVVPYSLRARPGAPVSMPLTWDELTPKITSDFFTIHNSVRRVENAKDDPWKEISKTKQNLTSPIKVLKNLGMLK